MAVLKVKIHPGILAALIGGIAAFVLSQFQLNSWIEQAGPEGPVLSTPTPPAAVPTPSQAVTQPQPVPGGLRVRNQTPFPVRLVLLGNQAAASPATADYRDPVHWDFAPAEGSEAGLILSLPDGNLRLESGDILVGFALDGSRRYWGPFVVGKTPLPERAASQEWQLTLRP